MPNTKEYAHQYYLKKIEEFKKNSKARAMKKYDCVCGGRFSESNKATHEKTDMHVFYMKTGESIRKPKKEPLTCSCTGRHHRWHKECKA